MKVIPAIVFGVVAIGLYQVAIIESARPDVYLAAVLSAMLTAVLSRFVGDLVDVSTVAKRVKLQHNLKEHKRLWDFPDVRSRHILVVYGGELRSYTDNVAQQISLATVDVLHELRMFLYNYYGHSDCVHVIPSKTYSTACGLYPKSHVVLIGGPISLAGTLPEEFIESLCVKHHESKKGRTLEIKYKGNEIRHYSVAQCNGSGEVTVTRDYAAIVTAIDSQTGQHFYWFTGNFGWGTLAAVRLAITAPCGEKKLQLPDPGGAIAHVIMATPQGFALSSPKFRQKCIEDVYPVVTGKDFSLIGMKSE